MLTPTVTLFQDRIGVSVRCGYEVRVVGQPFGIEVGSVLVQRREGEEIFGVHVDFQPLQPNGRTDVLRERIVELDILHAQVGRALDVARIGDFEQTRPVLRPVRLVGRHAGPVGRIPVVALGAVHVVRVVMDARYEREERPAVFSPEHARIGNRIPVPRADALQEDRQSDAVPTGQRFTP